MHAKVSGWNYSEAGGAHVDCAQSHGTLLQVPVGCDHRASANRRKSDTEVFPRQGLITVVTVITLLSDA